MNDVDNTVLWASILALAFGRKDDIPKELLDKLQENVNRIMLCGSEYVRDLVKEEENDRH